MNGIFQAFPDKIRMRNDQVSLSGGMRIDFARDGRTHSVKPAFGSDRAIPYEDKVDGCARFFEAECHERGLLIRRQIALDPAEPLQARVRVIVANETGS